MSVIKEFKAFAMKGNVIDLAIGVVIGAAFSKIISSLIDDVITPLLLKPALDASNLNNIADLKWGTVKYGSFISNIISFIIVAVVLFMVIKAMNAAKKKEEALPVVPAEPTAQEKILLEIRDALKNK
jgi:large conductance mechanosensitive channel